jgi:hypothetical protein
MSAACRFFAATAIIAMLAVRPADAAPLKAAVFPLEFIDFSQQGAVGTPPPAEAARLAMVSGLLRDRLAASGTYELVDTNGTNSGATAQALRNCQSCADEIARGAGAEIAVVGYVQKVSNLILNITIKVSEARSGKLLTEANADIRGNTDESWTHGVEWLVRNRLLAKKQP